MKKFTKILSLALALALVLSTTAFAATVYQVVDIDSYSTIDSFLANAAEVADRDNPASGSLVLRDAGTYIAWGSSNAAGDWSATNSRFTTDANGIKWFEFLNTSGTTESGRNGNFYVTPAQTWDYTAASAADEIYIVSYNLKVNPLETIRKKLSYEIGTIWASDNAGTGSVWDFYGNISATTDNTDITLKTYKFHYDSRGHATYGVLTNDTPYKLAVGYRYDETKAYPVKDVAINGVINSTSTGVGRASESTPKLLGFRAGHGVVMGEAIRDFKMYTIKNTEALNAIDVAGVVPTSNASVEVKFSLPVGAFDKNAVAIEGLTNGTDFTVSDVRDVVSNSSVYSKVAINFTKDLAAGTTYTITFPATTTNEIGTPIADATATFTTESAPTYDIALTANEGLSSNGAALTAATIGGKTVYFTATATNETGRATSGALVIGIYDANGLVKYAFANKSFADAGSNTFTAAFKVEDGQTAKAYVVGSASEGVLQ